MWHLELKLWAQFLYSKECPKNLDLIRPELCVRPMRLTPLHIEMNGKQTLVWLLDSKALIGWFFGFVFSTTPFEMLVAVWSSRSVFPSSRWKCSRLWGWSPPSSQTDRPPSTCSPQPTACWGRCRGRAWASEEEGEDEEEGGTEENVSKSKPQQIDFSVRTRRPYERKMLCRCTFKDTHHGFVKEPPSVHRWAL